MPGLRTLPLFTTLAVLALLAGGAGLKHPALGQARERGYERHDERGSHDERGRRDFRGERREERERNRHWERREYGYRGYDYGYDVPSYGVAPPPLVYSPPPPPPGINFLFSFR